jgi:hypothetical protein
VGAVTFGYARKMGASFALGVAVFALALVLFMLAGLMGWL